MSGLISISTSLRKDNGSSAETTCITRAPAVIATSLAALAVTRGIYPRATIRSPPAAEQELYRFISAANCTPWAWIAASALRAPSITSCSVVGDWPRPRKVKRLSFSAKAAALV